VAYRSEAPPEHTACESVWEGAVLRLARRSRAAKAAGAAWAISYSGSAPWQMPEFRTFGFPVIWLLQH